MPTNEYDKIPPHTDPIYVMVFSDLVARNSVLRKLITKQIKLEFVNKLLRFKNIYRTQFVIW